MHQERKLRHREYVRRIDETYPAAKAIAAVYRRKSNFAVLAADLMSSLDHASHVKIANLTQFPPSLSGYGACATVQAMLEAVLTEHRSSVDELSSLTDVSRELGTATKEVRRVDGELQMLRAAMEQREQTAERVVDLMAQLRPLEDTEMQLAQLRQPPDDGDVSLTGPRSTGMHRYEGGLAALAGLKARLPLTQTESTAALMYDWQRGSLLRMKAARAKDEMVDVVREKLVNLDGRLAMGTLLFVHLSIVPPGEQQKITRQMRHRFELVAEQAARTLRVATATQLQYEQAVARMHQSLGGVSVLRNAAEVTVLQIREQWRDARTRQLGIASNGREAYSQFKLSSRKLAEVEAACRHGKAMLEVEETSQVLTDPSVSFLLVGVSLGAPLRPSRLTVAVQELLVADLCETLGLSDTRQLRISSIVAAPLPEAGSRRESLAGVTGIVRVTIEIINLAGKYNSQMHSGVEEAKVSPFDLLELFQEQGAAGRLQVWPPEMKSCAPSHHITTQALSPLYLSSISISALSQMPSSLQSRPSPGSSLTLPNAIRCPLAHLAAVPSIPPHPVTTTHTHSRPPPSLQGALLSTSAHLGMSEMRMREVEAHYPTRVNTTRQQGRGELAIELAASIDSIRSLEKSLTRLSVDQNQHKASRAEATRRRSVAELSPSLLFCAAHGWDGARASAGEDLPHRLQEEVERWGTLPRQLEVELENEQTLKAARARTKAEQMEKRGTARLLRGIMQESKWRQHELRRCAGGGPDIAWNFCHHLLGELASIVPDDSDNTHTLQTGGEGAMGHVKGGKSLQASLAYVRMGATVTAALDHDGQQFPKWWTEGKICYYCVSQGATQPNARLHHRFIDCTRRKQVRIKAVRPLLQPLLVHAAAECPLPRGTSPRDALPRGTLPTPPAILPV